jgi:hypothetical protein
MAETHDIVSRKAGTNNDGEVYYRPAIADVETPPMRFIIEHLDAVVDPGALPGENGAVVGGVTMDGGEVVDWHLQDEYVREVEGPFDEPQDDDDIKLGETHVEQGYYVTRSVDGATTVQADDDSPWAQRYAEMTELRAKES